MKRGPFERRADLGQFWTPDDIALDMAKALLALLPEGGRILDPACGPATFSEALWHAGARQINLDCIDTDSRMVAHTRATNLALGYGGVTHHGDYLATDTLHGSYDALIMNPPYIRQELIPAESKTAYHSLIESNLDQRIDRRANLYALFLLKGIVDLRPGGILCAIVYDAISQSTYGKQTLKLIARHAEHLSTLHFRAPFEGVLVDAQVIFYRKRASPFEETAPPCYDDGLVFLGNLLESRRGTALVRRELLLAATDDQYAALATPFFVKQSTLDSLIVKADRRAYLAESRADGHAGTNAMLKKRAEAMGINVPARLPRPINGPLLFNYYIRKAPRHLWNAEEIAASDNFYVSRVKGTFPSLAAWLLLNSKPYLDGVLAAGRNQGNGLIKLQLFEYKTARVPDWNSIPPPVVKQMERDAQKLLTASASYEKIRHRADICVKGLFDA